MHLLSRFKGKNGGYGYTGRGPVQLSGVGILCSLFWKGNRGELRKGMEWVLDETEAKFPVSTRESTPILRVVLHNPGRPSCLARLHGRNGTSGFRMKS